MQAYIMHCIFFYKTRRFFIVGKKCWFIYMLKYRQIASFISGCCLGVCGLRSVSLPVLGFSENRPVETGNKFVFLVEDLRQIASERFTAIDFSADNS